MVEYKKFKIPKYLKQLNSHVLPVERFFNIRNITTRIFLSNQITLIRLKFCIFILH
ncbi:hypothetical protein AHMF7616_02454 [Adhaeribacter pallidiroseus]|uniref:Uncharacterized protein n=1 Tax=Adhaeribacter pallidiroseus TaxID=2072847 RepID=A0A369QJN5_9BACT|nr:hypothetical protein AHMF7616_02454 [Adhaeribacter pallidiroseus]